jgi:hemerythrin-like domain-containing protein
MMANNFEPVSATDRHAQAIRDIVDTIFNPHSDIVRRLRTMRNALTLENPEPLYDIETLDKAIKALEQR